MLLESTPYMMYDQIDEFVWQALEVKNKFLVFLFVQYTSIIFIVNSVFYCLFMLHVLNV